MSEQKLGWDIGTVKAEGNYMLEGREYCKHDHIPRKCDSCDYEEEIAKLCAALDKEKETHKNVMKHWMDTNKEMMKKANDHYKEVDKEIMKLRAALEEIANHYEEEISFDDCYMEVKVIAKDSLR